MITPALAALVAATAPAASATPPLFLTATEQGNIVKLEVRGLSASPFAGRFTLEAVGGSNNRSVQSGGARLDPGKPATFVALSLGGSAHWSAVLKVQPDAGAPYELRLGSAR